MTILLCDVGGTHVRFALGQNKKIAPHKMRVDQYPRLQDAILSFLQSQHTSPESISSYYLAFGNRNEWDTNPDQIHAILPNTKIHQVNDFEANARGVLIAEASDFMLLNRPSGDIVSHSSKTVFGIGTGLGLAYVCGDSREQFVQRTHGGHMLPARSPQHEDLYKFISDAKRDILIYEDMLSGRGLFDIYRYLSARNHLDLEYMDAEILMRDGKDNPVFQQALEIFFEVLGLFAHQAIAFGYSYGGVYLTGGVIDRLMLAGLFNVQKFMSGFLQQSVPIVLQDVKATPVYWIKDEFISLKGLLHLAGENHA